MPNLQELNRTLLKGTHTWEGSEVLDIAGTAISGKCALALDVNGIPHVLYQLDEMLKGKPVTTLIYANRMGGTWKRMAIWPKTRRSRFDGPIGIAVGPDNLPYLLIGTKMLRGNAENPSSFETKDLGGGYSFVIHQNGDIRVALASNGNYANYLHDHKQPWSKGWTLTDSGFPDNGGMLVLAEDIPWLITLESDGLRVRRNFEPSKLAAIIPDGENWRSATSRWSFYNHHSPWIVDIGARSWNAPAGNTHWFGRHVTRTVAQFSATPNDGAFPLSMAFNNTSLPAEGQVITLNEWDFDGDGKVDTTATNPTHIYDTHDNYSARLTVTDSAGASDTKVVRDLTKVDGSAATGQFLATAVATLTVTTSSLPGGTVGTVYNQALAATGGTTPYTWSRASGSLPAGLSLSTSGVISGTPTTAGTKSFTIRVRDKNGKTASKTLSITIQAAPLSITTTALADGYLTSAYSRTLTATGGKTAYTWSIVSGTLPAGLSLAASTGVISGTPTAAGAKSITVQVKDANGTTATKGLTLTVYALPSISTATLPAGAIGMAYSQTLAVSGGKAPCNWSLSAGTLPSGLTLSSGTGVISGTPTVAGSSSITFKVTDANAKTATKALSITINATPPSITTAALADGYAGVSYSQTLAATGGKTPYGWSRTAGSLPAGLSLNSAGVISGTPTTAGTSSFTVQVKDGNNATATKSLSITIVPAVSVASSTLPSGTVGSAYNQTLSASGGKTPYTWRISSGALPAGLSLNSSTGAVTGTPTVAGPTSFTAEVTDANNKTASGSIYVSINLPVSIRTSTLHDSFVGIAYSHILSATGGTPPYTWSIAGGSLPAGLSLNASTGMIDGTPTATGSNTITVRVRDASDSISSKAYTVNISDFSSIAGTVIDQQTGEPMPGVTVTLNLSEITNRNTGDFLYTCNNTPIAAHDYEKLLANDDDRLGCYFPYSARAKVRNPFATTDAFTLRWNGLSAFTGYDGEYLAQRFKPTKSGSLGRVSFYFSGYESQFSFGRPQGTMYVLLKSNLGGDLNEYVANSAKITVNPETLTGWIDFDFSPAVAVSAGQEYFIELQGATPVVTMTTGPTYRDRVFWGNGLPYPDGQSHQRVGGAWRQLDDSLAFRTYIDDTLDIEMPLPVQSISMHGSATRLPEIYLVNTSTGGWEQCNISHLNKNGFFVEFNSGDYTCTKTTINGNDYYDQNGWITVDLKHNYQESDFATLLATDQFNITFNRTLEIVTDANGAYSFNDLPSGSYTLTFEKSDYTPEKVSGTLAPGQQLRLNPNLKSTPAASLQGTIRVSGGQTGGGVTITMTDALGNRKSAISDSQGHYQVGGIAPGNYSITFQGEWLQSKTLTGSLAPGQTGTLDVVLTAETIQLAITYPYPNSTVETAPLFVAGEVQNADTVLVSATVNGITTNYPADIHYDTFSATLPISAGWVRINALASNRYGHTVIKTIGVIFEPPATLTGTVSDANNGQPLVSALVTVTDSLGEVHSTYTDASGKYTITNIPGGAYSLTITKDDYIPYSHSGTLSPGESAILNASTSFQPPKIVDINVAQVTSFSAVITWTTDQQSNSLVEFGTTPVYGNTASDQALTSSHRVTLNSLLPGTTYYFRIISTNSHNVSASSENQTFTTANPINITLLTPTDGTLLSRPDTMVRGTFANVTGNETGITVNGIAAAVNGNEFIANHVPLSEGENTISIRATDTAGHTATASSTVMANTTGAYLRISANIESGIAPLETVLTIDGSFSAAPPILSYTGPGTVDLSGCTSYDACVVRIPAEGTYAFTAKVTSPDGNVYQDTVVITALSKTALDGLLKAKWEGMKSALASRDIEGGLRYFIDSSREPYRQAFTSLGDQLPQIASDMPAIEMVYQKEGVAKYRVRKMQDIQGAPREITYYIYFSLGNDGLWKVQQF